MTKFPDDRFDSLEVDRSDMLESDGAVERPPLLLEYGSLYAFQVDSVGELGVRLALNV